MKKARLLLLAPLFALTACNQNTGNFNNNLPNRQFSISYNFDMQSRSAQIKCEFEYENEYVEIVDENFNEFDIENLIGGDELVVYYDDEDMTSVDHVLVHETSILPSIEVVNTNVPGEMTRIEFLSDGWLINSVDVEYIINADFSITPLNEVALGTILYGSYNEFEERDGYNFCHLIYVFSFNPREAI